MILLSTALLLTGLGVLTWYVIAAPQSQVLGKTLFRGRADVPALALTFDDGPCPETAAVLEALQAAGARATFFLCGANVERYPEIARRIVDAGHQIGNHTYSHPSLAPKTPGRIYWEIDRTQKIIESATGRRPELFRPPYGLRWFGLSSIVARENLKTVMWSVNSCDWKSSSGEITRRVVEGARAGDIILLHDGCPPGQSVSRRATLDALPEMLRSLGRNYRFVTISELERDS